MLRRHALPEQSDRERWCKTFTLADYPKCKAIALDMLEDASARDFAMKSLAQSLHYMGEHREARSVAEEVRREVHDFLELSAVHPFVSMSIVLARIAYFEGRPGEALEIAEEALAHARHDNAVSICQALAMGCIPVAVWCGDGDAARRLADALVKTAQVDQLGYWRAWGVGALHAVRLHFDLDLEGGELNPDGLDAMQADHLVMLDGRTISQLALDRVAQGLVGWTAPEVLRLRAATTAWYDLPQATALLGEARSLAERQGAIGWLDRIDQTRALLGHRYTTDPAIS